MRTVETVADLRAALAGAPRPVGLVPTMGAFHEGHLSLMRAARERCATVVVSLFVNPTQFDDAGDLAAYPRDAARDAALARAEGVDLLFAPAVAEVYPAGFATTVHVAGPADTLEGAHRPGHFDGVATVVAKLLGMVGPDVAFFGAKDAQQVAVIRRLVTDLDLPVEVDVRPTVREPDGLAMSSRNARLSPADRRRASGLSRALGVAADRLRSGDPVADALDAAGAELTEVEVEYLAAVDPRTFAPAESLEGEVLVAVAARVGEVRLIDNAIVRPGNELHVEATKGIPCNA